MSSVRAAYTLPYPSFMPGNKLYKISRFVDQLNNWWYFGNIAQIKYHLGLSDKYLVEARTLLEYKQYLLGVDALRRSTKEFQSIPVFVKRGRSEGKDLTSIIKNIEEASVLHTHELETMNDTSPEKFLWVPEKEPPTELRLHDELNNGISAVQAVVEIIKK
jgi:hypothetical protein